MTSTEPPADVAEMTAAGRALRQRIDEPETAASLMILLDNAELLSTMVVGLAGFIERGDMVIDAVAASVGDLKSASSNQGGIAHMMSTLSSIAPALQQLADSSMLKPETIAFLDRLSEAATNGAKAAESHDEPPSTFGLMKSLRDEDVRRGLDVMIEIARSLGQQSH